MTHRTTAFRLGDSVITQCRPTAMAHHHHHPVCYSRPAYRRSNSDLQQSGRFAIRNAKRPDRSWGPPSLPRVHWCSLPRVKQTGRGADHLSPPSAEVKNEYSCTCTSLCACKVCCRQMICLYLFIVIVHLYAAYLQLCT